MIGALFVFVRGKHLHIQSYKQASNHGDTTVLHGQAMTTTCK